MEEAKDESQVQVSLYEKEWDWMSRDDSNQVVKHKNYRIIENKDIDSMQERSDDELDG
ncbi:hypothetical protein D3C78_1776370 [compost metagenome]